MRWRLFGCLDSSEACALSTGPARNVFGRLVMELVSGDKPGQ